MSDIIKAIGDFAKQNARLFIALLIMVFILFLVLFPYIDANFLVYNRIASRIDILEKVSQLDIGLIEDNQLLKEEYDSILAEIYNAQDKSIGTMTTQANNSNNNVFKFISGGILFWIVGLVMLFQKDKDLTEKRSKRLFNKIAAMIICVLIGWGLAAVATKIPTIGSVWTNVIVFPCLQLAIPLLIMYSSKTTKN